MESIEPPMSDERQPMQSRLGVAVFVRSGLMSNALSRVRNMLVLRVRLARIDTLLVCRHVIRTITLQEFPLVPLEPA